jgi:excinuclease ABC subunit B
MTGAAARLEFERAALLRDQINALKTGDYKKTVKLAKAKGAKKTKPARTTKYPKSRQP